MEAYPIVKWLHVLSSVLLVGTGFGSAFYMFFANRDGDAAVRAAVSRWVVRADWWFTTPAGVVQPVTGVWLAHTAGWPLTTPWIALSLALYVVAGVCWVPVVWLQMRMHAMARDAAQRHDALPASYARYARWWTMLGVPAFVAMVIVYFLMVVKPPL